MVKTIKKLEKGAVAKMRESYKKLRENTFSKELEEALKKKDQSVAFGSWGAQYFINQQFRCGRRNCRRMVDQQLIKYPVFCRYINFSNGILFCN